LKKTLFSNEKLKIIKIIKFIAKIIAAMNLGYKTVLNIKAPRNHQNHRTENHRRIISCFFFGKATKHVKINKNKSNSAVNEKRTQTTNNEHTRRAIAIGF